MHLWLLMILNTGADAGSTTRTVRSGITNYRVLHLPAFPLASVFWAAVRMLPPCASLLKSFSNCQELICPLSLTCNTCSVALSLVTNTDSLGEWRRHSAATISFSHKESSRPAHWWSLKNRFLVRTYSRAYSKWDCKLESNWRPEHLLSLDLCIRWWFGCRWMLVIDIDRFPCGAAPCGEFSLPESLIRRGNKPQSIIFLLVCGSFFKLALFALS